MRIILIILVVLVVKCYSITYFSIWFGDGPKFLRIHGEKLIKNSLKNSEHVLISDDNVIEYLKTTQINKKYHTYLLNEYQGSTYFYKLFKNKRGIFWYDILLFKISIVNVLPIIDDLKLSTHEKEIIYELLENVKYTKSSSMSALASDVIRLVIPHIKNKLNPENDYETDYVYEDLDICSVKRTNTFINPEIDFQPILFYKIDNYKNLNIPVNSIVSTEIATNLLYFSDTEIGMDSQVCFMKRESQTTLRILELMFTKLKMYMQIAITTETGKVLKFLDLFNPEYLGETVLTQNLPLSVKRSIDSSLSRVDIGTIIRNYFNSITLMSLQTIMRNNLHKELKVIIDIIDNIKNVIEYEKEIIFKTLKIIKKKTDFLKLAMIADIKSDEPLEIIKLCKDKINNDYSINDNEIMKNNIGNLKMYYLSKMSDLTILRLNIDQLFIKRILSPTKNYDFFGEIPILKFNSKNKIIKLIVSPSITDVLLDRNFINPKYHGITGKHDDKLWDFSSVITNPLQVEILNRFKPSYSSKKNVIGVEGSTHLYVNVIESMDDILQC